MRRPLALVSLAGALATAGCGESTPTPEQEVRAVLTTFATAAERRDYQTICERVFAPRLLRGLQEIGYPCEVAMRNSLGEVRRPTLTVGRITVEGPRATAEVRTAAEGQAPSTDTVRLERIDGEWKISALGGEDAAQATPTPTPGERGRPGLDGQ